MLQAVDEARFRLATAEPESEPPRIPDGQVRARTWRGGRTCPRMNHGGAMPYLRKIVLL